MGIAALVIGIIAAILSFVPCIGILAFLPAVIGLVLGIVDTVLKNKKNEPIAISISGIVLNMVAIAIVFLWGMLFSAGSHNAVKSIEEELKKQNALQSQNSTLGDKGQPAAPAAKKPE